MNRKAINEMNEDIIGHMSCVLGEEASLKILSYVYMRLEDIVYDTDEDITSETLSKMLDDLER